LTTHPEGESIHLYPGIDSGRNANGMKRLSPLKTYILAGRWELKSVNGVAGDPVRAEELD
jgi:hypothetical protein